MKRTLIVLAVLGAPVLLLGAALLVGLQSGSDPGADQAGVAVTDPARQIARGAYLVRAGDCLACHTVRGGVEFAGGRPIATPFGVLFSPNITPDIATGIGAWNAADFWRALHNGKGKAGQLLYPAFPYPNYTRVTRVDADAMYAYLKTLPAVHQPNRRHDLRFPYNQRPLLALWRALYFRPGVYQPDEGRGPDWNRGAYLVQGLGHCSACHADRNVLGATQNGLDLAGGLIPILNWYAPPLNTGLSGPRDWTEQDLADLLKTGISARGTASGPMAEVVGASLQHLSGTDIGAIAGYLKSLPPAGARPLPTPAATAVEQDPVLKLGATLYKNHCVECHGADGAGISPAYPALAGNRALTGLSPVNPIRMVLNGGYPPSTGGNPRPYGMPPYGPTLGDAEVAALVSYIRQAWGNRAAPVDAAEVGRYRAVPVD